MVDFKNVFGPDLRQVYQDTFQMVQLFMDVLEESEFKGMFRDIRFAIIEDHNSKGRNYESFKRVIDHQ